jgi:hypothetical protein
MATAPSVTSIAPVFYTSVRTQSYGSCVALSITTGIERLKARADYNAGSSEFESFDPMYFYGTDSDLSYQGMNYADALSSARTFGVPRWELICHSSSDDIPKSAAIARFTNGRSDMDVYYSAIHQSVTSTPSIDFYDGNAVASALQSGHSVVFCFRMPNNIQNNVGSDGIIPQPDSYAGDGHMVNIIGLTRISGKAHWIIQNGWSEQWGNGGLAYLPYDWGESSRPTADWPWVDGCNALVGARSASSNPSMPTGVSAKKISTSSALVSWNAVSGASKYYVLAQDRKWLDAWEAHNAGLPWWASPWVYWWNKATTTGTSATITLDDSSTGYEVIVIAATSNIYMSLPARVQVEGTARPANWVWPHTITAGRPVSANLTASDWNSFTVRIGDFRAYKSLSSYAFSTAYTGAEITASIVNQARTAINAMSPPTAVPAAKAKGDTTTAAFFNGLRNSLNSIP